MGTLYYAARDRCKHCGRSERYLICKSFHTFRGYLREYESPSGAEIASWADWKHVLGMDNISVEDEYGVLYPVEDFIANVEKIPIESRRRQYDAVQADTAHYGRRRIVGEDWLDADGYSFYSDEFS